MARQRRTEHRPSSAGTKRAAVAVLLALLIELPAVAAPSPAAAHVVGLFSRLCYETMPDTEAAESNVGDDWKALTGQKLDAFRPTANTTMLKAWSFSDEGSAFSFAISKAPMDEQGKADFPAFAEATNVACSLVLNATKAPPASVLIELEKLLERQPDETYDEPPYNVSAWTGEAEGLLVVLYYYAPKSGDPGGVLAMTVFENP